MKAGEILKHSKRQLKVKNKIYSYYSLKAVQELELGDISRLPYSLKILLENLLRNLGAQHVAKEDISELGHWTTKRTSCKEIAYHPARVLMQDFTGVPAIVDLAAMRDALRRRGEDPQKINPLSPVDLVIDHSVMVDKFASPDAFKANVDLEMKRNLERYTFLRWGQKAFQNFRVVPPGTGICHQVNLEYLGQVVWTKQENGETLAYPDTLVGTDSHTTMVNGLAILGWGVGGIEAEAAMLGQPISMVIPEVVGVHLTGQLKEGTTATDLVLTITQLLREKGVVGKFVEFYGDGLDELSIADRATIANMAPEYGATCGYFPIDEAVLSYLSFTNRSPDIVELVEAYAKEQGLWRSKENHPIFTETVALDISIVEPSLSGPKRPQDRVVLTQVVDAFQNSLQEDERKGDNAAEIPVKGKKFCLSHGDVVIAAITSCTNTSNPAVMMAAGLLARNANVRGLKVKPWVKTSLAPGSKVVTDYLEQAGLQKHLNDLGFHLVGYGCTTCIGNSGPLLGEISEAVDQGKLNVCSVLSGNRNFEGRINPHVKSSFLASPPLVVAYALAGTVRRNLLTEPLGYDKEEKPVFLKDVWPTNEEVHELIHRVITPQMFSKRYENVFEGDEKWKKIKAKDSITFPWNQDSTYVQEPPFFQENVTQEVGDIFGARPLAILGDSVTTDHISPAGAIKADSPAGKYLSEHNVPVHEFNSYGSRRGNHHIMMRGTFANIRIRNEMVDKVGGYTKLMPEGEEMSIYEAAMAYKERRISLVVIGGKEYGTGSSRDWAAKGTRLLGVKAVIAESFERIHRSNLIGMGVLPLMFPSGTSRLTLKLSGEETFDICLPKTLEPGMEVQCVIKKGDNVAHTLPLLCRIDTEVEMDYYRNGGILQYVLKKL